MTPEQEGARCPNCKSDDKAKRRIVDHYDTSADPPIKLGGGTCNDPWHRSPAPSPHEGEWTLARLNTPDGTSTKWSVIEDEELHRAVLSDPLWEVVTVRETAPTEPRSISEEQGRITERELSRLREWVNIGHEPVERPGEPTTLEALTALLAAYESEDTDG